MTTPSLQSETIAGFFKKHLSESSSPAGVSATETAKAVARHGFTGSANIRYATFLEAFRSQPQLSADYAERYPACQFLPWSAFHAIRTALKLACDLPEFYAGAVPPEQIPWMDVFELDEKDAPSCFDACDMMELKEKHRTLVEGMFGLREDYTLNPDLSGMNLTRMWEYASPSQANLLRKLYRQFQKSFFVLAPPDAFTTKDNDFIHRFRTAVEALTKVTQAPNDPLVLKPCKGGCLVVAAWGDEGEYLNKAVRELNL